MDKFIEKTGKQKWYLNKFFIALYSGLILLFLGKGIDVWFKKSPSNYILILPKQELIEEDTFYHLKKLRTKYHPFIYSVEYDNYIEWRAFGFIKIPTKQWLYNLKIANLTDQTLQDINVGINYPCNKYKLYARSAYINNYNYIKDKNQWVYPTSNTGCVNYNISKLDSGFSITVELCLYSSDKPVIDDFDILIKCPEGKFEKVTPLQYKQVGWAQSAKQ